MARQDTTLDLPQTLAEAKKRNPGGGTKKTKPTPIPQPDYSGPPRTLTEAKEAGGIEGARPYVPSSWGPEYDYFVRGYNRGLTMDFLLGGAEILDAAYRAIGVPIPHEGPDTPYERAADVAGTTVGMIPGVVGGTANLLKQGLLSGAKYGAPLARHTLNTLIAPFRGGTAKKAAAGSPFAALGIEGMAGAGASLGEEQGALGLPPGPVSQAVGGMATGGTLGLVSSLTPGGMVRAGVSGIRQAVKGTPKVARTVTETVRAARQDPAKFVTEATDPYLSQVGLASEQATMRARAEVLGRVTPEQRARALQSMDDQALQELTAVQRTGEPNLLDLQRARTRTTAKGEVDVKAQEAYDAPLRATEQKAIQDLDVLSQQERVVSDINKARAASNKVIGQLENARSREEASEIVSENLGRAYDRARREEGNRWRNLPDDPTTGKPYRINTAKLFERYQRLEKDLSVPEKDDMPAGVRKMLGDPPPTTDKTPTGQPAWSSGSPFIRESLPPERLFSGLDRAGARTPDTQTIRRLKPEESFNNIHGFYSKMRETARIARANGKRNEARLATELADEAWDVLVKEAPGGPRSAFTRALTDVRTYSREFNQAFRQGRVGELLGFQRAGDPKVDAIALLQTALKGTGPKRAAALDDLDQALAFGQRGGSPLGSRMASVGGQAEAMSATDDMLKREFLAKLASPSDGKITAGTARTWMRDNTELLARRPQLRKDLQKAVEAIEITTRLGKIKTTVTNAFKDPSPGKALADVVARATPQERPTVRATVMNRILFPDGRPTINPESGSVVPNAAFFTEMVSSPQIRPVLDTLWTKAEMGRIEGLTRLVSRAGTALRPGAQGQPGGPTISGDVALEPGLIGWVTSGTTLGSTIFGVVQGAKMGGGSAGGSLKTASIGSMGMSKLAEWLLQYQPGQVFNEAVKDPEVYRALLTPMAGDPEVGGGATAAVKQAVKVLDRMARRIGRNLLTRGQQSVMPSLMGTGLAQIPPVPSDEYRQGMPFPRVGSVVGRAVEEIDQLTSPDRQENRR
jgi:hypothetical protein